MVGIGLVRLVVWECIEFAVKAGVKAAVKAAAKAVVKAAVKAAVAGVHPFSLLICYNNNTITL